MTTIPLLKPRLHSTYGFVVGDFNGRMSLWLKHVKGKDNKISDLMSRMCNLCNEHYLFTDDVLCSELLRNDVFIYFLGENTDSLSSDLPMSYQNIAEQQKRMKLFNVTCIKILHASLPVLLENDTLQYFAITKSADHLHFIIISQTGDI